MTRHGALVKGLLTKSAERHKKVNFALHPQVGGLRWCLRCCLPAASAWEHQRADPPAEHRGEPRPPRLVAGFVRVLACRVGGDEADCPTGASDVEVIAFIDVLAVDLQVQRPFGAQPDVVDVVETDFPLRHLQRPPHGIAGAGEPQGADEAAHPLKGGHAEESQPGVQAGARVGDHREVAEEGPRVRVGHDDEGEVLADDLTVDFRGEPRRVLPDAVPCRHDGGHVAQRVGAFPFGSDVLDGGHDVGVDAHAGVHHEPAFAGAADGEAPFAALGEQFADDARRQARLARQSHRAGQHVRASRRDDGDRGEFLGRAPRAAIVGGTEEAVDHFVDGAVAAHAHDDVEVVPGHAGDHGGRVAGMAGELGADLHSGYRAEFRHDGAGEPFRDGRGVGVRDQEGAHIPHCIGH